MEGNPTDENTDLAQSMLLEIASTVCDRLYQVDNYAALERIGGKADEVYPALRGHLENCRQCQSRYRMFQEALRG